MIRWNIIFLSLIIIAIIGGTNAAPQWSITSDWGTCNRLCNGGSQLRTVACVEATNGKTLPRGLCDPSSVPTVSQDCNTQPPLPGQDPECLPPIQVPAHVSKWMAKRAAEAEARRKAAAALLAAQNAAKNAKQLATNAKN